MSSVQAAADQSGKWAIVNMPKLDGIDGATNYANCGGASWAVSSNCKNTELAYDFLKSTFGASVELYDDLLPNAGAIASYLPAAESDVYNQPSEFYGGQTVYKDIVEFAGKVPAFDCGAYYSDVRSALTDAVTNIVQNNADIDSEMQNAQNTETSQVISTFVYEAGLINSDYGFSTAIGLFNNIINIGQGHGLHLIRPLQAAPLLLRQNRRHYDEEKRT